MQCSKCGFANPGGMRFCGNCGEPLISIDRAEERKLVTVLFADLSGFTKLARTLEPEDVSELTNICFERLNPVIASFNGIILKYEGDLVIAVFGGPVTSEDDTERAVLAALKMMENMESINRNLFEQLRIPTPLGLHVGINRGVAAVGEIGSIEKKEYTVMGDTVNMAARLKDAGKPGEILVSEPVFRTTRYLFEYESLEPRVFKGVDEPVKIYQPVRVRDKPEPKRGIKGLHSTIIGRDREIALLKSRIDDLLRGRNGAVFVYGEAGIGKSRLIKEIRQSCVDGGIALSYHETRCLPYGEHLSNWPVQRLVESMIGIDDSDMPGAAAEKLFNRLEAIFPGDPSNIAPYIAAFLSLPVPGPTDEKTRHLAPQDLRLRVLLSIRELLAAIGRERPVVVVIDDYHWIDASSLEMIEFIFDHSPPARMLFIALSRPEKERAAWKAKERIKTRIEDRCTEVFLKPLGAEASTRLVNNLLSVPGFAAGLKDRILAKAEGNPFYLEEIIRNLIDEGILFHDAGLWKVALDRMASTRVPDTVQAVILSRIDRLEKELKNLLQIASVIGRNFNERVLEQISDIDMLNLLLYLTTLEEYEYILKSDVEYMFRHPVIQEVVYDTIFKKRRRELHRVVAESMEILFAARIDDHVETIAHQYFTAGAWQKAFEYCLRSARKMKRTYLNAAAIDFYEKALKCASEMKDVPNGAVCIREKAELLHFIGQNQEALTAATSALELAVSCQNAGLQADLQLLAGRIHTVRSEFDKTEHHVRAALILYETLGDETGSAACHHNLGIMYSNLGDHSKALECYSRALEMRRHCGDLSGQAYTITNIGLEHYNRGDYEKALSFYRDSYSICQENGDYRGQAHILTNMGFSFFQLGAYEQALNNYDQALQTYEKTGDYRAHAFSLAHIGIVHTHRGDHERAFDYFSRSLRMLEEIGDRKSQANVLYYFGSMEFGRGRYEKALEFYERANRIGREIGDPQGDAYSLAGIALTHYCRGDFRKALGCFRPALAIVESTGDRNGQADIIKSIGMVNIELGEYRSAREELASALKIAQEIRHKDTICLIEELIAGLDLIEGVPAEAADHCSRAVELAKELKIPLRLGTSLLMQARIDAALGKTDQAREKFARAMAIIEETRDPFMIAQACMHYAFFLERTGDRKGSKERAGRVRDLLENIGARGWLKKLEPHAPGVRGKVKTKRKGNDDKRKRRRQTKDI